MAKRTKQLTEEVAERRRQEDESPRLRTVIPSLSALRLELSESRREGPIDLSHIKRIVVENAPSVFVLPCGEPRCRRGSYDLTGSIIAGLHRGVARIVASDTCLGDVGSAQCGRVMHCIAVAEYTPA